MSDGLGRFEARAGAEEALARVDGGGVVGAWLVRRSPGHATTELIRDVAVARRFVTIDRWESREAFERFKAAAQPEYEALDARCKQLTRDERLIGHFGT